MAVPEEVRALVDRFAEFEASYVSPEYKETEVRREFLDPLFKTLGWDVDNSAGRSPATKDVVHEFTLESVTAKRMPDYSFRIGGEAKFFLEAKKPSENLEQGIAAAFQVRTYGWSANLALSVLSDFQELAVYDCLDEPLAQQPAVTGRRKYFKWSEYVDRWDEIEALLSRDAVAGGSLEAFAATQQHDVVSVDRAFLREIEGWRRALAKDIADHNPGLSQRDLNFAVQQTIDRIVFLRICEDRGIENFGQLRELAQLDSWGPAGIYKSLIQLFAKADERYNSGLFHFRQEPGRPEAPDTLTPRLEINDRVLKDIIRRLYFPASAYRFAVFPADILGQVYEQFLGKVIRLDLKEGAIVEDKPEVRKAGGVYYTPTYIVSYMVGSTLGRAVAGKTPNEVSGKGKAKCLTIVDPACGSGSFLIEAYQFLLDWYRDQYAQDPDKWSKGKEPRLYQGPDDDWLLTGTERKRILLTHIFGVDIDPQAVEVTKLSLLLKVLESESTETIMQTMQLFHERALPDLANNIKRGNSLIGTDFYQSQTSASFEESEQLAVSAFDWEPEFPAVFSDGGFDVVIGNPPYLSIDDVWGKGGPRQRYIKQAYAPVYRDKTDILFYFLAKALFLSKGDVTFIVSRAFLEAFKADRLREFIAERADVRQIIDFRNFQVFPRVGITTAIVSLTRTEPVPACEFFKLEAKRPSVPLQDALSETDQFQRLEVPQSALTKDSWVFAEAGVEKILQKIDQAGEPVGTILHIGQGMQTGRNDVFGGLSEDVLEKWKLPRGLYFFRARNSDIQKWHIRHSGEVILYSENVKRFGQLPPVVQDHLTSHQDRLKSRAAFKRGNCEWWKFTWPLHKAYYDRPKLYSPYLASSNRFALDAEGRYLGLTDTTVLFHKDQPEDLKYILGVLNSSLLTFRFRFIGKLKAGGVLEYFWNSVSHLPIRRIDFKNPTDRGLHDQLVGRVERALLLSEQLAESDTEQDREVYGRQLRVVETAIDSDVDRLYGVSPEERHLIDSLLTPSRGEGASEAV